MLDIGIWILNLEIDTGRKKTPPFHKFLLITKISRKNPKPNVLIATPTIRSFEGLPRRDFYGPD